jgi:tetratricopeptide (TPR) repeat protein
VRSSASGLAKMKSCMMAVMHLMRRNLKLRLALFSSLILLAGTVSPEAAEEQSSAGEFERALQLQQSGDLEGAVRAYREFLQANPRSIEALSNLGAVYARLGRYSDAIAQYKLALEQNSYNIPIHFNLALAYYKSAQFPEAAAQLEIVKSAQPEDGKAVLLLADCHLQMGENKKVIEMLSPLQASFGSDQAFLYLLGTALIREGRPEGQQLVDKILRNGESAEAHLMLGTAELMASHDPEALKEFRRAIELNPTILSSHSLYGRALLDTGNRSPAIEAFRSELELNPNDFDSNLYIGVILKQDQKFDEALRYFERALEIRPQALDARYQIGSLYVSMGKLTEARQDLEQLVEDAPEFQEAHVSLATVYYRLNRKSDGDREKAIIQKLTEKGQANIKNVTGGEAAADLRGASGESRENKISGTSPLPKGLSDIATGESAPGVLSLQASGGQSPSPAESKEESRSKTEFEELASRATAAREADRVQEAIDSYRQALNLRDTWPEGWWYLGTLFYERDRYQEARGAFARLVTLKPNGGAGLAMLGLCEFQLRQYGVALEHLQGARALGLAVHDELTQVVWYHLGLLLNRSGQPEAALQLLFALAREQSESPQLLEALGLAGLEVPNLPSELPPPERELIVQAGRAEYNIGVRRIAEARSECEKLIADYPDTPNVHYLYGIFLLTEDQDAALIEFRREIRISPAHVRARLQIVFEDLRRGDYEAGLPYAKLAVALAPRLPASHYALGRVLFKLGENDGAIAELESAAKLAPDSPEVHYALFDAYAKAHRKSDALRERQIFAELRKKQAPQGGSTSPP